MSPMSPVLTDRQRGQGLGGGAWHLWTISAECWGEERVGDRDLVWKGGRAQDLGRAGVRGPWLGRPWRSGCHVSSATSCKVGRKRIP